MLRSEAVPRGIRIVGTRWLDINKGDDEEDNYRSRLVAKDFNVGKEGYFRGDPTVGGFEVVNIGRSNGGGRRS